MKNSTVIRATVLFAIFSAAPLPSMACGSPDLKTHVGKVLSVDKSAGNFTLLDAETMSPVTLAADAALLDQVSKISGNVVVIYEKIGDRLRALELK